MLLISCFKDEGIWEFPKLQLEFNPCPRNIHTGVAAHASVPAVFLCKGARMMPTFLSSLSEL